MSVKARLNNNSDLNNMNDIIEIVLSYLELNDKCKSCKTNIQKYFVKIVKTKIIIQSHKGIIIFIVKYCMKYIDLKICLVYECDDCHIPALESEYITDASNSNEIKFD